MRSYDYSLAYEEKDPNIKFRKCKSCGKIHPIKKMANKFTCNLCYSKNKLKKRCNKCHLRKSITEFTKNSTYLDGREGCCKSCQKIKR